MTHATILWLGTALGAAAMSIIQTVSGSFALAGHLVFDNNAVTNGVYVAAQQVLNMRAGGLDFVTNGTQSGVSLLDTNVKSIASYTVSCAGSGGLSKYDTCIIPPQMTTTGSIRQLTLMASAVPTAVGIDCSFVKARLTATGTVFTNFNNLTTSTGSMNTFSTGALRWNSADFIKCGTLNTPTSSFAAKLKVDYFDDTSE